MSHNANIQNPVTIGNSEESEEIFYNVTNVRYSH